MNQRKQNCVSRRPTMHFCAMLLLLLIFMFEMLSTANSANCLDGIIRKPPRFGKRSDMGFIQTMEQVHPCFAQLQRRSERLSKLKNYFNNVQAEGGEEGAPKSDNSEQQANNVPLELLLKMFSMLRRKNDKK